MKDYAPPLMRADVRRTRSRRRREYHRKHSAACSAECMHSQRSIRCSHCACSRGECRDSPRRTGLLPRRRAASGSPTRRQLPSTPPSGCRPRSTDSRLRMLFSNVLWMCLAATHLRGARLVFQAIDDSMIDAGIVDGGLLFVVPTRGLREAAKHIIVCRVGDVILVSSLNYRASRVRLISRNERYAPIEVDDETDLQLVGIVIGRLGSILPSGSSLSL